MKKNLIIVGIRIALLIATNFLYVWLWKIIAVDLIHLFVLNFWQILGIRCAFNFVLHYFSKEKREQRNNKRKMQNALNELNKA